MDRYCIKCWHKVEKETIPDLKKEYPYYCPYCDENLYSIETFTDKAGRSIEEGKILEQHV